MRRPYHNKYFVIGVFTLFLILAITPAIQAASISNLADIEEEFFKIEIEEIKADGNIESKDCSPEDHPGIFEVFYMNLKMYFNRL